MTYLFAQAVHPGQRGKNIVINVQFRKEAPFRKTAACVDRQGALSATPLDLNSSHLHILYNVHIETNDAWF